MTGRYKTSKVRCCSVVLLAAVLHGCVIQAPVKPGDPYYAPVQEPTRPAPSSTSGSLFQAGAGLELFGDSKAHRVGDILTIVLNERTVSKKSSKVEVTKESGNSLGAGPILGTIPTFKNFSLDTDIKHDREFTGEADADQSNSLSGNITVTVAEVLSNGNLVVRGEKWMTLNRGDEYIRISGVIRPVDVSQDNMVASTKLANARISYSGTGELADSNQMGWTSRFFNSPLWPF